MKERIIMLGLFCLSLSAFFMVVEADSQGPYTFNNCTGWDGASCNNAKADNPPGASYATTTTAGATMAMRNYTGFNIPGTATVTGIRVTLDTWNTILGHRMTIGLSKNSCSSPAGSTKNFNTTTSETTRNLGGDGDMWGTTWTPAQINATTFCVTERNPTRLFPGNQTREDFVRVTVWYTLPPVPPDINILTPNGGESFCSDDSITTTFIDANVISYVDSDLNIAYWNSASAGDQDTFISDWNVLNPDTPLFAEEFESLWDMNLNQVVDVNFVEISDGYANTNGADFNHFNNPQYSDSVLKYATSFNDVNRLPLDNNTFTVEFWIKHHDSYEGDTTHPQKMIFSTQSTLETFDKNGINILFRRLSDTTARLLFQECSSSAGCPLSPPYISINYATNPITEWTHFAWSFSDSGGVHRAYINGVEGDNWSSEGYTLDVKPSGLYIGNARFGNSDRPSFEGIIDRFVIYDWNKTAAEILYDYENDLNFYVFPNDWNAGTKQVARYRWNYSALDDGNYFIDANLSETSSNFLDDFDSSDASFEVKACILPSEPTPKPGWPELELIIAQPDTEYWWALTLPVLLGLVALKRKPNNETEEKQGESEPYFDE